jgi:hypothetical protein
MIANTIILVGVAVVLAAILLQPRLTGAPWWRAVVTPLASIIGSGFLVSAPILSAAAGNLAFVAMAGLCAIGYLFGAAVRHNIRQVEPILAGDPPRVLETIERLSSLALVLAYFISVAYYLNLFSAFALRAFGLDTAIYIRGLTSLVLVVLGIAGLRGGLAIFERIETLAVGIKLAIVGGLVALLVWADATAALSGSLSLPTLDHATGWQELRVIMGLVVLVQGFETSRYLGEAYDARLRVRTMIIAQAIATAIYISFVFLATPYFSGELKTSGAETAVIDLLAPLGLMVTPMLILAALASQLSAAVADINGSSGLLSENLTKWVTVKLGYVVTVAVALLLTWTSNIYEIISYASRAFVAYYALQSLLAVITVWRENGAKRPAQLVGFAAAFVLALVILAFAAPASA